MSNLLIGLGVTVGVGAGCVLICWRGKPCRSGQGQERGQRLLACGEDGSGRGRKTRAKPASVKQEPTEATMHEVSHA